MRVSKKKIIFATLGVLLLILVGVRIYNGIKKHQTNVVSEARAIVVRTGKVARAPVVSQVRVSGNIRPLNEVEIISKVSGRVIAIHKDVGDEVLKGDVLSVIEHTEIALQEESAKANADVASANLLSAKKDLERAKKLFAEEIISSAQLEGAELKHDLLKAQKSSAEAQASLAAQARKNAYITSPINGVVTKKMLNLGAMVSTQNPVFSVQDQSFFKLVTSVDAGTIPRLKKGQAVTLIFDTMNQVEFKGSVSLVSPSLDAFSRRASVEIQLDKEQQLIPNMFMAGMMVLTKSANVLVVPNNSIFKDSNQQKIYKITNNIVKEVLPRLGAFDEHNTEVLAGLSEGDVVAISGLNNLTDGVTVTIE